MGPRELLRPPPHRGPLIAAGAVPLAAGLALVEVRLDASWVHAAVLLAGALIYWLGVQAPNEDGAPPAYQSVLLVVGLGLLWGGLLRATGGFGAGALAWTAAAAAVPAAFAAFFRRSALCVLIAALLLGLALASWVSWVYEPHSVTPYRWLLLAYSGALVLASLRLREPARRHAEMLVDTAGLAIAVIGVTALIDTPLFSVQVLPGFWEVVLLGAGFGLLAFGALERSPGPAWLGALDTALFVLVVAPGASLYWWPLVLVGFGLVLLAAGLRPRRPLPPEPTAYKAGEAPLAARVEDSEEMVFRVRDDSR